MDVEELVQNVNFSKKKISIVAIVLGFLFLFFQMISWNEADERLVHQSILTGDLTVISSPGPYLKNFGSIEPYKKVISGNFTGKSDAQATAKMPMIPIRFLDTSTGEAKGIARFRLPGHIPSKAGVKNGLLKIHEEFGSQAMLISNLIIPSIDENVKASARMMSVEQHYSGGNGQLSGDFSDQLSKGIYETEQIIDNKTVKKGEDGKLSKQQRVTVKPKLNKAGKKLRNAPLLIPYGIIVAQASIIDIDYEEKVDKRLEAQKRAAADEALSRQNLKKAEQAAKTEVAQGAQRIAKQRADSEVLKTKEMIDAQRMKANAIIKAKEKVDVKEQQALEQVQILKQQRLEAKGMDVLAAARRRAKTSALDPKYVFDETLKAEIAIKKSLYTNLGKTRLVPEIVIGGNGSGSNGSEFMRLLSAEAALSLKKRLTTK